MSRRHTEHRPLVVCGVLIFVLLAAVVLLLVNFPAGYNTHSGLHLESVALFRSQWPYPTIALSPDSFRLATSFTLLGLWGVYLVAFMLVWRQGAEDVDGSGLKKALALTCLFNICLALYAPPVLSADLWHYALFGRMVSIYHLNPYIAPATSITGDPFWSLAIWRDATTQYGPLWTQIEALVTLLAGDSALGTALLFKMIGAVANIGGGFAVAALAQRIDGGSALRAVVIYCWNPAVLLEGAAAGHNDATMAALTVVGLLLAARNRLLPAVALLVASAMIKYLSLLLLALVGLYSLARAKTIAEGAVKVLGMSTVASLVIVALYAPFLEGLEHLWTVFVGLASTPNPMPNPIGISLHHWANHPMGMAIEGDSVLLVAFGLFMALLAYRLTFERSDLADVSSSYAWASLVYCYLVFGGSFTWYLISPAAAIAVSKRTLPTFCFVMLSIMWGLWLMLTGYANPVAAARPG